jgi:very-short-patch-repair endonuclease
MDLGEVVERLGGVCTSRELRTIASWRSIAAALESEQLVRVGRGTYSLPGTDRDRLVATRFRATLAVLSAAQAHGWKVLDRPDKPWLSIPRGRPISPRLRRSAHLVRSGSGAVTDPLTTALDCLRQLSLREAVSVVDSALRSGAVGVEELETAALTARGPGSSRMREALPHLSPLSANPFESCLGLIAHEFDGFERQVPIELPGFTVHPDLVNPELGIVIEGDSWEFHASTPELFARDCERYTLLTVNDWLVLRFTYKQVVHDPEWVRSVIEQAVAMRVGRNSDNGWRHTGQSAA